MGNHPSLHEDNSEKPQQIYIPPQHSPVRRNDPPVIKNSYNPHNPPQAIYVEKRHTTDSPDPISNYYRLNTQQYIPPVPKQEAPKKQPAKYKEYTGLKPAERQVMTSSDIEITKIDPFGILQHTPQMSLVELAKTYVSLRNIHHPDKGGEQEKFIQIMNALKTMQWIDNACKSDRTYLDLKKNFTDHTNQNSRRTDEVPDQLRNMTNDKFNRLFEENRMRDDEEEGYGRFMEESNGKREDIEVPRVMSQYKKQDFNNEFTKVKKTIRKNDELVKYQVPESLTSGNLGYIVLGDKKEKKYTGSAGSLQYTDYMDAFTKDNVLVDDSTLPKHIKKRIDERDLNRSIRDYKRSDTKLTNEQQAAIEAQEEYEKQAEMERQRRFKEQEKRYSEYEKKINNRLGYTWS
jgi:hypothetical protein